MPRIFAHLLTYRVKRIKHAIYSNKNFMFSFDIIMLFEKCSYIFDLDLFDKSYPDCIHNTQKSIAKCYFPFCFLFLNKKITFTHFLDIPYTNVFSDIPCIPVFFVLFAISLVPKVAHAKHVRVFFFF